MKKKLAGKFVIKLEGVKELMGKLENPNLARAAVVDLVRKGAEIGEATAIENIKGGTGVAVYSIQHKVWPRTKRARVYTLIREPRAKQIEKGRKRNNPPSLLQAFRWLVGEVTSRRMLGEEFRESLAIQKAIRDKGSRGRGYIQAARRAVERALPRLSQEALDSIERMVRF